MQIDINADIGESYAGKKSGQDELIFPHLSSCNIACGFHGGDPSAMLETIQQAIKYNVRIGAHPSYPDLNGFGRRKMNLTSKDLYQIIQYQIQTLADQCRKMDASIVYVKPHGALYNSMVDDLIEAETVIQAIIDLDLNLALMGLAGSQVENLAKKMGVVFIAEAFADRRYTLEGKLQSRNIAGAVISDAKEATSQVLSIFKERQIQIGEEKLSIQADSICVHGDNPAACTILEAINQSLAEEGIVKKANFS